MGGCSILIRERARRLLAEQQAAASTVIMDTLLRLFPATLSPDLDVRRASEHELRQLEGQPGMLAASFQIVASSDVDMSVRQAAAMYVDLWPKTLSLTRHPSHTAM